MYYCPVVMVLVQLLLYCLMDYCPALILYSSIVNYILNSVNCQLVSVSWTTVKKRLMFLNFLKVPKYLRSFENLKLGFSEHYFLFTKKEGYYTIQMEKPEAIPIIMCTVFYETGVKEAVKIMAF